MVLCVISMVLLCVINLAVCYIYVMVLLCTFSYNDQRAGQDSVEFSQILFNAAALYAVCRSVISVYVNTPKLTQFTRFPDTGT